MHVDDGVGVLADIENRVPVPAVNARKTNVRRTLGKRDCMGAQVGTPLDLSRSQLRIPEGHDGLRNEATNGGSTAPLLDNPIVERLDLQQREVLIGCSQKSLTSEAGNRGKAETCLSVILVHGDEPAPCW